MEHSGQQIDVQQKISDYQEIIHTFAALLQEENQALRDYDVVSVSELYEQKSTDCKPFIAIWWLFHQASGNFGIYGKYSQSQSERSLSEA